MEATIFRQIFDFNRELVLDGNSSAQHFPYAIVAIQYKIEEIQNVISILNS